MSEPDPADGSSKTNETAGSTAPAKASAAPKEEWPGRCVHPTPAEPARPAPPAGPAAGCPPDPTGPPELERGQVTIPAAGAQVSVEIVEQDEHRLRGLMYRTSLADSEGMLFVFDARRVHRFWMRNTCLPLDMLFIDRDGLIVGIEENVPTLNDRTYQVPCPSVYVLEVNAGWSRRHGVRAGQRVELSGIDR